MRGICLLNKKGTLLSAFFKQRKYMHTFKCKTCFHRTGMCRGIKRENCLLYEREKSPTEMYHEELNKYVKEKNLEKVP